MDRAAISHWEIGSADSFHRLLVTCSTHVKAESAAAAAVHTFSGHRPEGEQLETCLLFGS